MYETEWFGLRFEDIVRTSAFNLAGQPFYEEFYRRFFEVYTSYEDLPETWRRDKSAVAGWIKDRIAVDDQVLSIGCGIGFVESVLLSRGLARNRLSVTDISASALRWLSAEIDSSRIHIGHIPYCLPQDRKYNVAYLVAAEYALSDPDLIALLATLRERLQEGGALLLISASIDSRKSIALDSVKDIVRWTLHCVKLRDIGQFWGWARRPDEIILLLKKSGFGQVHFEAPHSFEAKVS